MADMGLECCSDGELFDQIRKVLDFLLNVVSLSIALNTIVIVNVVLELMSCSFVCRKSGCLKKKRDSTQRRLLIF